jgi:hypothetical protein
MKNKSKQKRTQKKYVTGHLYHYLHDLFVFFIVENIKHLFSTVMNSNAVRVVVVVIVWKLSFPELEIWVLNTSHPEPEVWLRHSSYPELEVWCRHASFPELEIWVLNTSHPEPEVWFRHTNPPELKFWCPHN